MNELLVVQLEGEEAMVSWGKRLGRALRQGGTVFLRGELGAGKTTLCRGVLRSLGYTDIDLYYDDNGKPHLADGSFISITHSFNFSAIIVSKRPVGIDIEKQRKKIQLIAKKFIGYEFEYLDTMHDDYVRNLTVIWCIKESLYKLYATPGLSFRQHTLVIPFMLDDKTTVSWIDYKDKKKRYMANFFEFEGFTCAYTI